jgi:hypothetical protein
MEKAELDIRVCNTTTLVLFFLGACYLDCLRLSASATPKKMHNLPVLDVESFVLGLRLPVAQMAPAPNTVATRPNTIERVSLVETRCFAHQ